MQSITRSPGLIDQVTEVLRREIRQGRWPVGSRIPTEPELARITGAGRNTVREAVQSLVHAGLLDRRQGSGTFVLADSSVAAVLRREIDPARRRELLELRQALEVTAATLAAQRRSAADIDDMRRLLGEIDRHHRAGDLDAAARADAALHRAVVVAAHNMTYLEVYEGVVPTMTEEMLAEVADSGTVYLDEHRALVDAIDDRDAARAATTLYGFLSDLLSRDVGPG
ncbi:FadR/GntR family transcriptional regulator [Tomitella fengzijianii]|uniref:FadR family transcriptional regulator n=1 Tax=Tomitella fengzijianii TaxID=2597660 RepID=A0A516X521_9ACTN|nr:FCD domain-containing protein [Tomitella fengzijianii]QDQ98172.1 FadR family transcriptional regulator [Tomitella fengzijianii]